MSVTLTIKDETSSGKLISESLVLFPIERITVRELIEARVTQEVEKFNAEKTERFYGLVHPTETEKLLNGVLVKKGRTINVENQKKVALHAFKTNGFFLLVDNKQLTELDDVIFITPETKVSFLKLVPLAGG